MLIYLFIYFLFFILFFYFYLVRIIPVGDEYMDMNMFETYFVLQLKYSHW